MDSTERCFLCPNRALSKRKWSSVMDKQVAKSVTELLESTEFCELFLEANYCGPCQEFVLNVDFLMRCMTDIQSKILKCQARLSQCIIDNYDFWNDAKKNVPGSDKVAQDDAHMESYEADASLVSIRTDVLEAEAESFLASDYLADEDYLDFQNEVPKPEENGDVEKVFASVDLEAANAFKNQEKHANACHNTFSNSNKSQLEDLLPNRRQTRSVTAVLKPSISYTENQAEDSEPEFEPNCDSDNPKEDSDFIADISENDSDSAEEESYKIDIEYHDDSGVLGSFVEVKTQDQNIEATEQIESVNTSTTKSVKKRRGTKRKRISVPQTTEDDGKPTATPVTVPRGQSRRTLLRNCHRITQVREPFFTIRGKKIVPQTDGRFACFYEGCTKTYLRMRELKFHIHKWHTERTPEEDKKLFPKRFLCLEPSCDFVCRSDRTLQIHSLQVHKNDSRPYKCKYCPKSYGNVNVLRKHEQSKHLELTFVCDICGKVNHDKFALRRHFRSKHNNVERLNCGVCGKKYLTVDDYNSREKAFEKRFQSYCMLCVLMLSFRSTCF